MAIPKTLKRIDTDKAEKLIKKHLENGTGYYECDGGDFIYKEKTHYKLLRRDFLGEYETGIVVM